MTTGAEVHQGQVELSPSEQAWAELRKLQARQRELPELMREAASRGSIEAVVRLRGEFDQMPVKLWAAEYTAVQAELAERPGPGRAHPRRPELLNRARELVSELHGRPAWPGLTPGQ